MAEATVGQATGPIWDGRKAMRKCTGDSGRGLGRGNEAAGVGMSETIRETMGHSVGRV